ncbi:Tyw1p [Dipodascopsis tothii]|uniref:Tyw1p n=1 Tax=Dipodascopsis tothii TaxID=44089 RepID=UPI0034CF66B9
MGSTAANVLETWHQIRVPLIVGGAAAWFYWKYCLYQPHPTVDRVPRRRYSGGGGSDDDDKPGRPEAADSPAGSAAGSDDERETAGADQEAADDATEIGGDGEAKTAGRKAAKRAPKVFRGSKAAKKAAAAKSGALADHNTVVFYSTLTGTSERYAAQLQAELGRQLGSPDGRIRLQNVDYVDDLDQYFLSCEAGAVYLFVVPSYVSESPLDFFVETLKETYNDFRVDSRPLSKLAGFAVFGLGDHESYPDEFCYQAKDIDKYMGKLGAPRAFPIGFGDVKTTAESAFADWTSHLATALRDPRPQVELADIADSDDEAEAKDIMDVEDLGRSVKAAKPTAAPKEMVGRDSPTYAALTKQGYTIVGSHSGVKICRWTKSALRGRGSCYKFAFYGIKSHLCMETTPSLSCSSKCVFCWRHGTNPVGTTWRWQVDQPEVILQGALEGHYKKIKQMRGVPGVQAERFTEAFTVRHCALSLVGEPIFYPYINEFVGMLHDRHISSFLVCNAQHPDELARMNQVTQLYVSIDASSKESLKAVDRPLHRDFWERFQRCLDILREKQSQRTVFRLTLVKGFNVDEVEGYADLVARGLPCFIEVKGVTYCGTSKSSPLTMQNVPFYEEVLEFVEALTAALKRRGMDYDIAAEHGHSCCVLIAHRRFFIDGEWHTHIDYARFFELLESGAAFGPMDYTAPTPAFAQYGSAEKGFNPDDERVVRKSKAAPSA